MDMADSRIVRQHLIDPEICIRCNTCEATCPIGAITHDSRNYVVDVAKCKECNACIPPCPTGAIDNWRRVPRGRAYSLEAQFGWDVLPDELPAAELAEGAAVEAEAPLATPTAAPVAEEPGVAIFDTAQFGAKLPPWSAAHAYTNLYGPKAAQKSITATVAGNVRVTEVGRDYDTHHVVLDFGATWCVS